MNNPIDAVEKLVSTVNDANEAMKTSMKIIRGQRLMLELALDSLILIVDNDPDPKRAAAIALKNIQEVKNDFPDC